jgi:glycosyltransferase involved in cell wall biosynthesis
MRITLSVAGRLHAFEVARELQRRDQLAHLMTSYPRFGVTPHGIAASRVQSNLWIEGARRLWNRSPMQARWNSQYYFSHQFDRWAASHLKRDADVLVGWSGSSLETIRRAKHLGMIATVDRGSSHILTQQKLLEEEYARFGLRFTQTHPKIIETELREYAESDFIHVPSLFSMKSFRDHGVPQSKLVYLPYGFVPSAFKSTAPKDKGFRLVFCGNLSLRKGLGYLLDAFSQLKLKDAEAWIFGAPSPELETVGLKLNRPGVKYFGKQPWSVLADHFSRGTVFCLPSVEDGFAIVLLQAMACGLPVIGTENTGTPDAIRSGTDGFVVPIRNVDALKESILWCYQNREHCDEMGRSAQKRVYGEFQWSHYGDRVSAHYEPRLSGSRAPSSSAGGLFG